MSAYPYTRHSYKLFLGFVYNMHVDLQQSRLPACGILYDTHMNNHVHSAPQEHIERERKDSEHRKNTQNIHNITTIHKPHGLEK